MRVAACSQRRRVWRRRTTFDGEPRYAIGAVATAVGLVVAIARMMMMRVIVRAIVLTTTRCDEAAASSLVEIEMLAGGGCGGRCRRRSNCHLLRSRLLLGAHRVLVSCGGAVRSAMAADDCGAARRCNVAGEAAARRLSNHTQRAQIVGRSRRLRDAAAAAAALTVMPPNAAG